MDTDKGQRANRRRTLENYQIRLRAWDSGVASLLLAVGAGRLIKTLHRFVAEQFFPQLEVIALPDLPGRKQSGYFGRGQPLHEDFDRLGGGRGFVWDCHAHILTQGLW